MKIYIPFIFVLFLLNIQAQDKKQNKLDFDIETSFSIGVKDLYVEQFETTDHIDFLNYVDFDPDYCEDFYLKFGLKYGFFKKMYTDINFTLESDLIPDTFDVSIYYFPKKSIGIGIGSMRNKMYITSYEDFYKGKYPDYYILDDNIRQFINYNTGYYISSLIRPIYNDRLKIDLKLDFGLASFNRKHSSFYLKRKLSNEKLLFDYVLKGKFSPFINPKLNIRLKAFNINKSSIGFLLNSGYYYSKSRFDNKESFYKWTDDDKTIEYIKSPRHTYYQFTTDLGVYLRW